MVVLHIPTFHVTSCQRLAMHNSLLSAYLLHFQGSEEGNEEEREEEDDDHNGGGDEDAGDDMKKKMAKDKMAKRCAGQRFHVTCQRYHVTCQRYHVTC